MGNLWEAIKELLIQESQDKAENNANQEWLDNADWLRQMSLKKMGKKNVLWNDGSSGANHQGFKGVDGNFNLYQ